MTEEAREDAAEARLCDTIAQPRRVDEVDQPPPRRLREDAERDGRAGTRAPDDPRRQGADPADLQLDPLAPLEIGRAFQEGPGLRDVADPARELVAPLAARPGLPDPESLLAARARHLDGED